MEEERRQREEQEQRERCVRCVHGSGCPRATFQPVPKLACPACLALL